MQIAKYSPMIKNDLFLSKLTKNNCKIVFDIKNLKNFIEDYKSPKKYFITLKNKKKLSKLEVKKYNLKFISKLSVFKFNLLAVKDFKIDPNLKFVEVKKKDWKNLRKIIPDTGTSRIFLDNKIKKKVRASYLKEWIHNFFKGKRGDSLLVVKNKKKSILGFALLRKDKNNIIIEQLLISKIAIGQGIGTQLLKFINIKNPKKPSLSGVHSPNIRAMKFYSSHLKCKVIREFYYYHRHQK